MKNPEDKSVDENGSPPSPYRHFSASAWGRLRDGTPLPLTEEEVVGLRGRGETVSIAEVEQIYLPLSRLLNLYAEGVQTLHGATNAFLGSTQKVPYIIGVAGSVAVGKSTTSRILKELLARWPNHPKVELVTTDGFLHPNKILEERGLADRKGFPESFDLAGLRKFLTNVKSGEKGLHAPTYSHIIYDVVPDLYLEVDQPDILIVEGLNVLQPARPDDASEGIPFVSDFFDFSIFIDAEPPVIEEWYVERFLGLRQTAFSQPDAYFSRYANLDDVDADRVAREIWKLINLRNLEENILPSRWRADLVLHKSADHTIDQVSLRKI
jgi:type I pantothenate kinase